MRLELTRRGDYAVRAMLALARAEAASGAPSNGDGRLSVARIAASEAIPPPILPSVMRLLTRAALVAAQTGRTGGYRLARRADRISLLEIIEAIEGDTRRRTCILRGGPCLANGQCAVHEVFSSAQEALRDSLATATLARVVTLPPSDPTAIPPCVLSAQSDRRARELTKEPNMEQASFFPDWRTLVRYAAPRPEPAMLVDADGFRVLVAGLEPGGEIPAHLERLAVYHVLEGQGEMTVDDNRFALTPGATVIAGRGSRRGIRALTRLAFLAVRIGPELESDD